MRSTGSRYADDLVDHLDLSWEPSQRRKTLEAWATGLEIGQTCHDDLRAFLTSMAMDLEVARYATYQDFSPYVHGSAA
jgi:phytoene/squalene synthetase